MNFIDISVVSLTTMAFSIALFGAVSLLGDPALRRVGWGLALFLAVAAFDNLAELIGLWGFYPQLVWVGGLEPLVTILYGPTIYFYVLTVTGRGLPAGRVALLLVGPLLLALGLIAVVLSLPKGVHIDMLVGNPIADRALGRRAGIIMILMQGAFIVVTFGFMVACWRALDDNIRRLSALFSSIEDRRLSWLRGVMILIFAAWAWAALQGMLDGAGLGKGWLAAVDAAITLSWVATLVHFGIRQRPALQDDRPGPDPEVAEKYARSALDEERMQKLGARLVQLMGSQGLYRDPSLSLRMLADRAGASPNYISQTLNDHLGVSFFDFVNGFRVEEAETLLRDTDRSVTDIALDVGFNSRSTFNAAVRKHRGTSPSELRKPG